MTANPEIRQIKRPNIYLGSEPENPSWQCSSNCRLVYTFSSGNIDQPTSAPVQHSNEFSS